MISYNIELNSNPNKGSKAHTILLRITVDRKHARIKLPYSVRLDQFNKNPNQNQYIRQNHKRRAKINAEIEDKIQEAKDIAKELENDKKAVTALSIKERMIQPKSSSFFDFAEKWRDELEINKKVGNFKKYKTVIQKLKDYRKGTDLLFQEIDVTFLSKFQSHLEKLGNMQSTIHGNLRAVRAIYYRAIEAEVVQQGNNPFFTFKLKSGKPDRVRLTIEEINLIEKLDLSEEQLIWHVRNAFMFAFYCAGIRVTDILMMKWKHITNGRLEYEMFKTKMKHSIKLVEQAKKILGLYKKGNPDEYIFPFFHSETDYSDEKFLWDQRSSKTALLNKYLKDIATKAEINKKISTHTARHTFADLARQKDINLYNISKALGHSKLNVTENYLASFDDKAVDDTMDELFK